MMTLSAVSRRVLAQALHRASIQQSCACSTVSKIGNRDVVGFGFNGENYYVDRVDFPMPAIRFKENTPDVQALRSKELGDWNKLTLEEKKALYRASFCQTFAEFKAPSGEWKGIVGISLVGASLAVWVYLAMKLWVYGPLPDTITNPEKMEAQLQRLIDMRNGPIEGLASKWDYTKGEWK